jgi:hypothetical protein
MVALCWFLLDKRGEADVVDAVEGHFQLEIYGLDHSPLLTGRLYAIDVGVAMPSADGWLVVQAADVKLKNGDGGRVNAEYGGLSVPWEEVVLIAPGYTQAGDEVEPSRLGIVKLEPQPTARVCLQRGWSVSAIAANEGEGKREWLGISSSSNAAVTVWRNWGARWLRRRLRVDRALQVPGVGEGGFFDALTAFRRSLNPRESAIRHVPGDLDGLLRLQPRQRHKFFVESWDGEVFEREIEAPDNGERLNLVLHPPPVVGANLRIRGLSDGLIVLCAKLPTGEYQQQVFRILRGVSVSHLDLGAYQEISCVAVRSSKGAIRFAISDSVSVPATSSSVLEVRFPNRRSRISVPLSYAGPATHDIVLSGELQTGQTVEAMKVRYLVDLDQSSGSVEVEVRGLGAFVGRFFARDRTGREILVSDDFSLD